jgi:hypothetical protein
VRYGPKDRAIIEQRNKDIQEAKRRELKRRGAG